MKLLVNGEKFSDLHKFITSSLTPKEAEKAIVQYGDSLLNNFKKNNSDELSDFIDFVIHIITLPHSMEADAINPSLFSPVFSFYPQIYLQFLNRLLTTDPTALTNTLWNDFLVCTIYIEPEKLVDILTNPNANYSVEQALISFQESILDLEQKIKADVEALDPKKKNSDQRPTNEIEAEIDMLKAKLESIQKGLAVIYEKRELYLDILDITPINNFVEACQKYGPKNENLWLEAVKIAIAAQVVPKNTPNNEIVKRREGLEKLIKYICENKIIPIPSLLSLFKANSLCVMSLINKYVIQDFQDLQNQIKQKQETLNQLNKELEANEQQVDRLEKDYFQIKSTTCQICNNPLTRPSVHFYCGHTFHSSCLGDESNICPKCKESHRSTSEKKLEEIKKSKANVNVLEMLENSDDPQAVLNDLLTSAYFDPDLNTSAEDNVTNFMNQFPQL